MSDKLRVAVVGLGIGQLHVLAFTQLRHLFHVVDVCDTSGERAAGLAGRLRGCRSSRSLDEVLAHGDVDVVDLCTPPYLHRQQVLDALAAGVHVICEKPLVGSVAEVDELGAAAAAAGRTVMPVFQYRFGHGLQKLRALVDAGVTGPLRAASVEVAWRRGADYYAAPWRGRWETELGGVLITHAVHALDMLTYVAGPVARVSARIATLVNPVETEDTAALTLELRDGGLATLLATLGSVGEITRHRLVFADLTAESNTEPYTSSSDPWTFAAADADVAAEVERVLAGFEPAAEGYAGQFERFAHAVAAGQEPPVTLADARAAIETMTAAYKAASTGAEVALPLAAGDPWLTGWRR